MQSFASHGNYKRQCNWNSFFYTFKSRPNLAAPGISGENRLCTMGECNVALWNWQCIYENVMLRYGIDSASHEKVMLRYW